MSSGRELDDVDLESRRLARNAYRRAMRAAEGTTVCVTCPASRHVLMIGDFLSRRQPYAMLEEEPEFVAESLLIVVGALWKARAEIARLLGPEKVKRRRGHSIRRLQRRFDAVAVPKEQGVRE